jgi:hypothetical protein
MIETISTCGHWAKLSIASVDTNEEEAIAILNG